MSNWEKSKFSTCHFIWDWPCKKFLENNGIITDHHSQHYLGIFVMTGESLWTEKPGRLQSMELQRVWPKTNFLANLTQFCVSFRWPSKWFSYTYTYCFSNSFSIYITIRYWAEFPVLCSRSLLVIYVIHSSEYMLIPNSQFIPPLHLSLW